jgi:hypothetical protein
MRVDSFDSIGVRADVCCRMLSYADISILLQVLICELIALILGVVEEWKGAGNHPHTTRNVILIVL